MARTANKSFGDNLHELLIFKLQSLLDVENELVKTLQKMSKAATDPELREAFDRHTNETENQVRRAEKALVTLGAAAKKVKNAGIRGLEEDASFIIKSVKNEAARDAALIGAAQTAEHMEIAAYSSARAWAEAMNHTEVAELLSETLKEEEAADQKLTELAIGSINERANTMNGPEVE